MNLSIFSSKKYRSILFESFSFITIGLFLFILIYKLGENLFPIDQITLARKKAIYLKGSTIEAISVGNSHNTALRFEPLGLNGYYLWKGGQDIFESTYLVMKLRQKLPNLKYVFMPISIGNFYLNNSLIKRRSRTRQLFYYSWGTSFEYILKDFDNYIKGKLSPIIRPNHWHSQIKGIIKNTKNYEIVDDDGMRTAPFLVKNLENIEEFHEHALKRCNLFNQDITECIEKNPFVVNESYKALSKMIKHLRSYDIYVIFYTPPYFYSYLRNLDQKLVIDTKNKINDLANKYENAYYLDYSSDSSSVYDISYFIDSDHMNLYGAIKFSKLLRDKLQESEKSGLSFGNSL